jgi:pimeloyl-ACP methyl ester carboxylesterase
MQLAIAGSRLEVIAGAGHVSNVERPAAFNHVLSEFLVSLTAQ